MTRAHRFPLGTGLLIGTVVVVTCVVVSIGVGPIRIPPAEVVRSILARFGDAEVSQLNESVVVDLRMPRVLFGALTGAALAVSGAALQSLFNNPLADPGIIGVSAGASTGAVAAIVALPASLGALTQWLIPAAAFLGGLGITALIYALAKPGRSTGTSRLLLVGIAVGAGCSALTGYFTYVADDDELQELVFWQMGSFAQLSWAKFAAGVVPLVVGAVLLVRMHRRLDLLTLGERQAQHLGLNVHRTRISVVVLTALLTGAAVCFVGTVSFVGLVVPHIVRMAFGPAHKAVLPMSVLVGAILLVVADSAARTIAAPSEVPVGLFTATLGAPFFLLLVLRTRSSVTG